MAAPALLLPAEPEEQDRSADNGGSVDEGFAMRGNGANEYVKDLAVCYVCGPENALGLRVPFERVEPSGSRAIYVARKEHAGWNDVLHGGVTFSLMDEACGWTLFFQEISAVTARVETRFHKPIRVGTEVAITASATGKRRLYNVHAEIRTNDDRALLLAEADAVMFELRTPG